MWSAHLLLLSCEINNNNDDNNNNSIKILYLSAYQQRVAYNRQALNLCITDLTTTNSKTKTKYYKL
jgi:hypothetical protein